jgi:hypothetical protein
MCERWSSWQPHSQAVPLTTPLAANYCSPLSSDRASRLAPAAWSFRALCKERGYRVACSLDDDAWAREWVTRRWPCGRKMRTSMSDCSNAQVGGPLLKPETRQQMHASQLGPHALAAAKVTPRLCTGITLCGVKRQACFPGERAWGLLSSMDHFIRNHCHRA